MAYTRDIPFEDSSRAQRRRNSNTLETKALPRIGDIGFDPKAEDGDGDGKVQDNSAFERPAIPLPSLTLSGTTGGNGSDSEDDTPEVVAPPGPVAPQPMPRTSMQVERNEEGVRVLRGKWSPLQGSDWLKDSTKEDIAEALVPYSLDDAIALMTQILCYGEIPKDKREVLEIKSYVRETLLKGFEGEMVWDFSPEGRLAMKNTIINSMAESPGFEFMIRTYGAPAMMWTDPLGRDKLYAKGVPASDWGIFHQGFSKKRNRQEGAGNGASIMGAALGNMVIVMNGSNANIAADRKTGYGIDKPTTGISAVTDLEQDFVDNFGLSRGDTLRHEYGHWFWAFHMGSPFMYGSDNMMSVYSKLPDRFKDRKDRAQFIGNATGESVEQVLDRMEGLKWRFDDQRTIVSADQGKTLRLAERLGFIKVSRNPDGSIANSQVLPHEDAAFQYGGSTVKGSGLWQATLGRLLAQNNSKKVFWTPQDTWDTASTLAIMQDAANASTVPSKYSMYQLPELRGAYANSSAQELFAEAVAVFLSPDRDLWEEYLTPSMVVALSEAFNIPIKDGKLSPVWDTSRRGLASRSMQTNRSGFASKASRDIIDALVEDPSLYDLAPKKIPEVIFDMVGGDPEQFRGARIRNIKPQGMWTEERVMELVNQIRIEPSPDGIFTTIAPPVPEFQNIIGFDGDFSNVRIPSPEARIRMYKSILDKLQDYSFKPGGNGRQENYREPYSEIFGEKLSESVAPFLISRYEYLDLRKSVGDEYTPGTDADSFDAVYERFLRVPSDMMFIEEMYQGSYIQTMHDVVGHFGTGRGFDRHGEWANFLAMVRTSQNMYSDNPEYMDELPFDLFQRIMIDQLQRWEMADMRRGVSTAEEALGLLDDISKKASKMYIDGATMKKIIQLDNPDTYMPVQTKSLLEEPLIKRAVAYIHSLVDNNIEETGKSHSSFIQPMPQKREVKGKMMGWVSISTKSFLDNAPSLELKSLNYTKPEVRERLKNRIMAGDKGGKPGQWSARKAQLLALEYRKAGGGYRGGKRKTQRSLTKWTREKWRTSDGKNAIRKGGTRRYLPSSAWQRLTPAQRTATNRKKTIGSRQGNQFVANTESARSASRSARKD